jgi:large subunit ribosomal protein L17
MRHQKRGRKFNRSASHRKAMMSNLASALILHKRIQTTDAKGKELRGFFYVELAQMLGYSSSLSDD